MSRFSRSRLKGSVQHIIFWLCAALVLLLDPHPRLNSSLPFALGVACLAGLAGIRAAIARERNSASRWPKAWLAAGVLLLGLLSIHGTYLRTIGPVRPDTVQAIAQTDPIEAMSYLLADLSPVWILVWLLCSVLMWATMPRRVAGTRIAGRAVQRAMLLVGLALVVLGRLVVTEPVRVIASYREGLRALERVTLERRLHPPAPIASRFEGIVIVIIGESASRHHMGLYGYPRDTTPLLSGMAGELALFRDVISNRSTTMHSLREALTLEGHSGGSADIFRLARAGGFETIWLSNQNQFGVLDNPVRILAQQADLVRYHDPGLGRTTARRVYDEAMLPTLDEALKRPARRKLLFLHMMSSHAPYCWTKPASFDHLREAFGKRLYGDRENLFRRILGAVRGKAAGLDCYDNSIRYVDRFVVDTIRRARQLREPAVVLYLSDHGEAPLLGTGHDASRHSSYHIEIPFIAWANEAYRSVHAAKWAELSANVTRPFSLSLLTPTIGDLLGLETPAVRKEDSLFSSAYRDRPRFALDHRIHYDARHRGNDYRENSRVFLRELGSIREKVWAHRVNSLGALLEAKNIFSGIEVDIVFSREKGTFEVRHPPVGNFGLTLRELLRWSADRPGLKLWLDWKNPDPANLAASVAALEAIDREFGIKQRSVVETPPWATQDGIALVSRRGFRHAHYLPTERILDAMADGSSDRLGAELRTIIARGRFAAVTYDARLYPFVEKQLHPFLASRNLGRYSWDVSIDAGKAASNPARTRRIVAERDLDALLIRFPSDFAI